MPKSKKPILPTKHNGAIAHQLKNIKKITKDKGQDTKGKGGKEEKGGKGGKGGDKAGGRDSGTKDHPKGVYRINPSMSGSLVSPDVPLNPLIRKKLAKNAKLSKPSSLPQAEKRTMLFPTKSPAVRREISSKDPRTLPKKDLLVAPIPLTHLTHSDTTHLYLELLKKYHKKRKIKVLKTLKDKEKEGILTPLDFNDEHDKQCPTGEKV